MGGIIALYDSLFFKRSVCITFSDYIDYLRGKRIGVIGFGAGW